MRICEAKHGNMENELLAWFCHAQNYSIVVAGQTVKMKAHEMALILKASVVEGCSGSKRDRTLHRNRSAEKMPKQTFIWQRSG
jgi:hypothetical protein